DGNAISVVPHPNPGTFNRLYAVDAVSANDVWAVGEYASGVSSTLALHWDGSAWSQVPTPNGGHGYNQLLGVTAIAATDGWAVGFYDVFGAWKTLTTHYDGSSWQLVDSPQPNPSLNVLNGVAAVSQDEVLAVGTTGFAATLALRFHGGCWKIARS